MNCILDTSAWYALVMNDDSSHQEAVSLFQQKLHILVPFPVFLESAALLHNRQGKEITTQHMSRFFDNHFEILHLTERQNKAIWKFYNSTPNYLDYVDCSVIWLSRKLKLPVLAFDKHFKKAKVDLIR